MNEIQTNEIQQATQNDLKTQKKYKYKTIQAIVDEETYGKFENKVKEEKKNKTEYSSNSSLSGKIIKDWLDKK